MTLQPKTRGVDPSNPLRPLAAQETVFGEDWGLLRVSGENGLLTIVAGIWAWGKAVKEENRDMRMDWKAAVDDCTFMMNGLKEYALANRETD